MVTFTFRTDRRQVYTEMDLSSFFERRSFTKEEKKNNYPTHEYTTAGVLHVWYHKKIPTLSKRDIAYGWVASVTFSCNQRFFPLPNVPFLCHVDLFPLLVASRAWACAIGTLVLLTVLDRAVRYRIESASGPYISSAYRLYSTLDITATHGKPKKAIHPSAIGSVSLTAFLPCGQ